MFRKTVKSRLMRASQIMLSSHSSLRKNGFFNNPWNSASFSSSTEYLKAFSVREKDQEAYSTHIEIKNTYLEDIDVMTQKVVSIVNQYPDSHLTFMTPTDLAKNIECRRSYAKGNIHPGHIHSSCTDESGKIMEEGDASFSTNGKAVHTMLTPVYDSRLDGYQPRDIAIRQGVFTNTIREVRKWAALSIRDKNYPLFILARPFTSQEECKKYLEAVIAIKQINAEKDYVLMSYYSSGSDQALPPNNCVSVNKQLNEKFFNVQLNLGDNPTPQAAYLELIKSLYPSQQKYMKRIEVRGILSEVHYEKEALEKRSFVI